MDDRVGELLAERARIGSGAGGGIALSVFLHGSIAAAAVYAAMHASAPQQVSTLDIRFAPATAIQEPRVVPGPERRRAAAPEKHLKIPEPVADVPKPAAKPEPKTVPFSPFGQSTRKGSEKPIAPAPHTPIPAPAATPGIVGGADIPIGASGVTGLEGGDFPYTIYIDRMKSLIGQRWLRPQADSSGVTATVYFIIDRDGTIRDAKNEISSGNGTFDRAALRAVLEASPLPPLPFAYNGTYLGVRLTFR
jgi:TonB family protein